MTNQETAKSIIRGARKKYGTLPKMSSITGISLSGLKRIGVGDVNVSFNTWYMLWLNDVIIPSGILNEKDQDKVSMFLFLANKKKAHKTSPCGIYEWGKDTICSHKSLCYHGDGIIASCYYATNSLNRGEFPYKNIKLNKEKIASYLEKSYLRVKNANRC